MIKFYNWFICKLFNKCVLETTFKKETPFQVYCRENPWAVECRIYDV